MSGKGDKKRRRAMDAYTGLQRAAALSAARVDSAVQPFGLSATQFGVLDTIATRGAVHQQELAEALDRSKAQMTAIIDALESRGLVRRERHQVDRRFITVHLTPEGRVVLAETAPARTAAIVELMSELTGDQRARLARLCRRLLRALDPYEDADPAATDAAEAAEDAIDAAMDDDDDSVADATSDGSSDVFHPPLPSHTTDAGTALPSDSRADTGS
jgi:MarR family 2-MHQ and catechol resistance regulon transcriptional repressor